MKERPEHGRHECWYREAKHCEDEWSWQRVAVHPVAGDDKGASSRAEDTSQCKAKPPTFGHIGIIPNSASLPRHGSRPYCET
jgi:hypothetical protein